MGKTKTFSEISQRPIHFPELCRGRSFGKVSCGAGCHFRGRWDAEKLHSDPIYHRLRENPTEQSTTSPTIIFISPNRKSISVWENPLLLIFKCPLIVCKSHNPRRNIQKNRNNYSHETQSYRMCWSDALWLKHLEFNGISFDVVESDELRLDDEDDYLLHRLLHESVYAQSTRIKALGERIIKLL